jgi:hypothetical protein
MEKLNITPFMPKDMSDILSNPELYGITCSKVEEILSLYPDNAQEQYKVLLQHLEDTSIISIKVLTLFGLAKIYNGTGFSITYDIPLDSSQIEKLGAGALKVDIYYNNTVIITSLETNATIKTVYKGSLVPAENNFSITTGYINSSGLNIANGYIEEINISEFISMYRSLFNSQSMLEPGDIFDEFTPQEVELVANSLNNKSLILVRQDSYYMILDSYKKIIAVQYGLPRTDDPREITLELEPDTNKYIIKENSTLSEQTAKYILNQTARQKYNNAKITTDSSDILNSWEKTQKLYEKK